MWDLWPSEWHWAVFFLSVLSYPVVTAPMLLLVRSSIRASLTHPLWDVIGYCSFLLMELWYFGYYWLPSLLSAVTFRCSLSVIIDASVSCGYRQTTFIKQCKQLLASLCLSVCLSPSLYLKRLFSYWMDFCFIEKFTKICESAWSLVKTRQS